jgi:hypothetical protein
LLAAAGTGVAGTAASLAITAVPAGAQPIGDCTATTGVVVAVDFTHWGGSIERGCAADASAGSTNGLQAMHTAGFVTAGVAAYGTAFVCRITDPSTGAADPSTTTCSKTPPASAYWSYWHAIAGQTTWSYSQVGVVTYRPPPGSVTAWVFGAGAQPSFHPTTVRATGGGPPAGGSGPTTTSPGAAPTGLGATTSSAAGTSTTTTTTTAPPPPPTTTTTTAPASTTTTTTTAGAKPGGTAGSTSPGGTHRGTKGGATARIVDVDPMAARLHRSSGSPLPVVVGAVAVVGVASGAAVIARRRRRAGDAG